MIKRLLPAARFLPALLLPAAVLAYLFLRVGPLGLFSGLCFGLLGELLGILLIDLAAAFAFERTPESANFLIMLATRRMREPQRGLRRGELFLGLEQRKQSPAAAVLYSSTAFLAPRLEPTGRLKPRLARPRPSARPPRPASTDLVTAVPRPLAAADLRRFTLLVSRSAIALSFLGIAMIFSATAASHNSIYGWRALFFTAIGVACMFLLSRRSVVLIKRFTPLVLGVSILLLFLAAIPGIGSGSYGASRYIVLGPLAIAPAELAKLALVLYGAYLLAVRPARWGRRHGLAPYLLVCGLACQLIFMEPDLGTAVVIVFTCGALVLVAGARIGDLLTVGVVLLAFAAIVTFGPREGSYFSSRALGINGASSFESEQAEIAIGSGRMLGRGYGESIQKYFYVFEPYGSMIAAILAEEFGLIGVIFLLFLFLLLAFGGLSIARRAPDPFSTLLAAGATTLIVVQALINLFSVFGLFGTYGILLPFVSYGNFSLLVMFSAAGLILAVARHASTTVGLSRGTPRSLPA